MKVVNKIGELIQERNMDEKEFAGLCYAKGLSIPTAIKLARGDARVYLSSWLIAAEVLNVGLAELIELTPEGGENG